MRQRMKFYIESYAPDYWYISESGVTISINMMYSGTSGFYNTISPRYIAEKKEPVLKITSKNEIEFKDLDPKTKETITEIVQQQINQQPRKEVKEMNYFNVSFILAVVIITVITVKFIIPRLNWGTLFRPLKKWVNDIITNWKAS